MPQIDEILARAGAATEQAHVAVARLDRTIFRTQADDPTPDVWFAHHITNEAFKAMAKARAAGQGAREASIEGDGAVFNKLYKECRNQATLATYLAMVVIEMLSAGIAETVVSGTD